MSINDQNLALSLSLYAQPTRTCSISTTQEYTHAHTDTPIVVHSALSCVHNHREHNRKTFVCAGWLFFMLPLYSMHWMLVTLVCFIGGVVIGHFRFHCHLYTSVQHVDAIFFKLLKLFAIRSKFYCYLYCILCIVISKHYMRYLSHTCPRIMCSRTVEQHSHTPHPAPAAL